MTVGRVHQPFYALVAARSTWLRLAYALRHDCPALLVRFLAALYWTMITASDSRANRFIQSDVRSTVSAVTCVRLPYAIHKATPPTPRHRATLPLMGARVAGLSWDFSVDYSSGSS